MGIDKGKTQQILSVKDKLILGRGTYYLLHSGKHLSNYMGKNTNYLLEVLFYCCHFLHHDFYFPLLQSSVRFPSALNLPCSSQMHSGSCSQQHGVVHVQHLPSPFQNWFHLPSKMPSESCSVAHTLPSRVRYSTAPALLSGSEHSVILPSSQAEETRCQGSP